MDAVTHLLIYRFVIALLLGTGGVLSIYFGYRLFASSAGLMKALDKLAINTTEFKVSISGMSAGGVLIHSKKHWALLR